MNIKPLNHGPGDIFYSYPTGGVAALYIREEPLQSADLINQFIFQQPLARLWGQATAVSSDAIRIPVAVNTAHAVSIPIFWEPVEGQPAYNRPGLLGLHLANIDKPELA